jgi:hypothetical protein
MTRKHLYAPLALAAVLGACLDNQTVQPPTTQPNLVDPLFASYVAFGNSITAGFQSGGILDSTQLQSYAVLLAGQMGTTFNVPLLNRPGCPPPYANVFTQELLGPAVPGGCGLRHSVIPPFINNLAIPGAAVVDVYDPLGAGNSSNALTQFLGGGSSQVDNARLVSPTFATVWIGNNDALGAVLDPTNPGNPADVTSIPTFAERYTAMMDSLDDLGTLQGGALLGVVQVGLAPYLTQGRVWKVFEQSFDALTTPLNAFDVSTNCLSFQALTASDTAWVSVPFSVGGPMLAAANAKIDSVQHGTLPPQNLVPVVMDCSVDAQMVTVPEMANLFAAVASYNAVIAQAASDRDWVYIDPNALLAQLVQDPTAIRSFPAFPGLPGVTTDESLHEPFGWALSLDGIHPSATTHVLVANALIAAINAKYGTAVPAIQ